MSYAEGGTKVKLARKKENGLDKWYTYKPSDLMRTMLELKWHDLD